MNPFVTILISVLVFGFLIFVHEFGHYIFARIFKVKIYEFSIGMGPRILTFVSKKTGIRYSVAAIPFGGYVSMAGEDGVYRDEQEPENDVSPYGSVSVPVAPKSLAEENSRDAEGESGSSQSQDDPNGFDKKPAWQRLIITVAGAFVNVLVGFIVLIIFTCASDIGGTTVHRLGDVPDDPKYNYITSDDLLMEGDIITEIDGKSVVISDELAYEVMRRGNEPVDVTVIRDGKTLTLRNVQFPVQVESGQSVGRVHLSVEHTEKSFGTVLNYSFRKGALMVRMCWESLFDLITGRYGFEAVSGPVGVSSAIGEAASSGIPTLLWLIALISINLGVMNMLPIPALDGGRTLTLLIEIITRKKMPPKVEQTINGIGLALLLGLSVVILVKDVIWLII